MNGDVILDILTSLFWLGIFSLIAFRYQKRKLAHPLEQKLFWGAALCKLLGATGFGVYAMLIQQQGDTVEYMRCLGLLWEKIHPDPSLYFSFLSAPTGDDIFPYHIYFTQGSPLAVIKVGLILGVFTFNSFWGMTVLLAGVGFFASWQVYKAWNGDFGKNSWWGAFILFFLPSILFWGSGWSKDGFICLAICVLLGNWLKLRKREYISPAILPNIAFLFLAAFLLVFLKPPLLPLLVFSISMGLIISWVQPYSIQTKVWITAGLGLIAAALLCWQQAQLVHLLTYLQWHIDAFDAGQSAYALPELGRIRIFVLYIPYLAISGLFRPAPWEWTQPLVALGGIEILLIWVALFFWIRQKGLRKIIHSLFASPFSISLLIFSLGLAVAAAMFSQNFGTLLRYRMPALFLFLLSFWGAEEKKSNK